MDEHTVYTHAVEYHSAIKSNQWIASKTQLSLKNINHSDQEKPFHKSVPIV